MQCLGEDKVMGWSALFVWDACVVTPTSIPPLKFLFGVLSTRSSHHLLPWMADDPITYPVKQSALELRIADVCTCTHQRLWESWPMKISIRVEGLGFKV